MKKLNKKTLKKTVIAFAAVVGVVTVFGTVISRDGMLAQVFTSQTFQSDLTLQISGGVETNSTGQKGITLNSQRFVRIIACSAAGGGGGGDRGLEDGSNWGSGGGGGGGGGKGNCRTRDMKVRSGDVLRWSVGMGGAGGTYGELNHLFNPDAPGGDYGIDFPEIDTHATNGSSGGPTTVAINGQTVLSVEGGHGGQAGTSASGTFSPGWGGAGGSLDTSFQQAWGHRGENGQNTDAQTNHMGSGGYGGNGEGPNGILNNRGYGGSSWGPDPFGGPGLAGGTMSGGGGGGGGAGRWYDHQWQTQYEDTAIQNRGGMGGPGGNGFIQIYW